MIRKRIASSVALLFLGAAFSAGVAQGSERKLLWGDTHLHTAYSFDAYLNKNESTDPDTAYRYAKGLPVVHPLHRARIQIGTPLDFLVVSDHAELTSVPLRLFAGDESLAKTQFGKMAAELVPLGRGTEVFEAVVENATHGDRSLISELMLPEVRNGPWQDTITAADRHNDPGNFTALIGWEWSSLPDAANLHRIVVTDGDAESASRYLPYGSTDSTDPEDLWHWLEETSKLADAEFVAIPHNMNISKSLMYPVNKSDGSPVDVEYAQMRARWEPVSEVTQIKGDSETHPLLSPNDEFAEFETYRFLIDVRPDTDHTASVTPGDYARGALLRGLAMGQKLGVNPYKFGMIGSTDSHTAMASAEENNFHGKMASDSIPEAKSAPRIGRGATGWDMSASGLAAVWAEDNTREAIVAAFQRKEVYATSGPRIQVQFYGGWHYRSKDLSAKDPAARGRSKGVPMGGDLPDAGRIKAPSFMVFAARDPVGANLDRIQIVKGWVDADGQVHEHVFDVAASDGRKPGPTGKLQPVGSTVNLKTASYTNSIGAASLSTVWRDPDFNPKHSAFYYARILEIPTPRHSLYDAVALQQPHVENQSETIQERAYTSPIWYTPADSR